MIKTFIILLVTTACSYGQFHPNSIGVVYLTDQSSDTYHLTILFPIENLQKPDDYLTTDFQKTIGTFEHEGKITFFDNSGELLTVRKKVEFKIEFWCENDGGIQYRPSFATSIKKSDFKRKIEGIKDIQNIACFAIINETVTKSVNTDSEGQLHTKLKGDYDNDGDVDCLLWTYSAEDCDGEPTNELGIMLQVGADKFRLRCCGP